MTGTPGVRTGGSAAAALTPLWLAQVADLRFAETQVRLQRSESVHRFRVAIRRLRSNLSAFESLLDVSACRRMREGLGRTAAVVGGTRDAEVVRQRLEWLLDASATPVATSTRDRLLGTLEGSLVVNWERGLQQLDSPEYDQLTRSLDAFADLPPWSPTAARPAEEVLRPVLDSEWSRFRRQARRALDPDPDGVGSSDARLHDARKAAKRTRYVAEALTPSLGKPAKRVGRAAERVQAALGEHQDCVLTQAFLREIPPGWLRDPDEASVLARLRELEASAAAQRRAEFARLFHESDRPVLGKRIR